MRSLTDAPYVHSVCLVGRVPGDLVDTSRELFIDEYSDFDAQQIVHVNCYVTRLSDRIFKAAL